MIQHRNASKAAHGHWQKRRTLTREALRIIVADLAGAAVQTACPARLHVASVPCAATASSWSTTVTSSLSGMGTPTSNLPAPSICSSTCTNICSKDLTLSDTTWWTQLIARMRLQSGSMGGSFVLQNARGACWDTRRTSAYLTLFVSLCIAKVMIGLLIRQAKRKLYCKLPFPCCRGISCDPALNLFELQMPRVL